MLIAYRILHPALEEGQVELSSLAEYSAWLRGMGSPDGGPGDARLAGWDTEGWARLLRGEQVSVSAYRKPYPTTIQLGLAEIF